MESGKSHAAYAYCNEDLSLLVASSAVIPPANLRATQGKLMKEESYDALVHGTQEGEAATWASHYAKDSAMNADLAVQQRVVYPEHPVRPKRELDYQVQQAEEAHAAAIDADGVQVIVEEKVLDDRLKVPAMEFRRLISLAHSADKYVEEMVLPILDDAQSVAKTESEAEHFLVGPIWDQNLLRLSHHFATKIQRLWRKKGLNRLVRVAREEAMGTMSETCLVKLIGHHYNLTIMITLLPQMGLRRTRCAANASSVKSMRNASSMKRKDSAVLC